MLCESGCGEGWTNIVAQRNVAVGRKADITISLEVTKVDVPAGIENHAGLGSS